MGGRLHDPDVDAVHVVRVLTHTLPACFGTCTAAYNALDETRLTQISDRVADAPETGDDRWNALIEGAVAHLMHAHDMAAPPWTNHTSLAEGWAPTNIYSDDWHIINVMTTPVELLEKGIVLSHENFRRL